MNIIILASCFLLIFCHGARHQHAPRPQNGVVSPAMTPGHMDARGKGCDKITKGFDSWGNQDDFVSEFPVDQQRKVLLCLEKLKQRGAE